MNFDFSPTKNNTLKQERGICFEDVIYCIENDMLLDILEHPNKEKYSKQKIYIVAIEKYAYLVPFVENDKKIFLKTIFPSRKATKIYLTEQEDKVCH
ncbi:MAG: toxin [Legionellales bacterium]|nr:MAG: toxin [Legionellales bacterium]